MCESKTEPSEKSSSVVEHSLDKTGVDGSNPSSSPKLICMSKITITFTSDKDIIFKEVINCLSLLDIEYKAALGPTFNPTKRPYFITWEYKIIVWNSCIDMITEIFNLLPPEIKNLKISERKQ